MSFPVRYTPELAKTILEEVAAGKTLTDVLEGKPGMPHPSTFRRWVVQYPDLARAYEAARTVSALSLEEEALDTARAIARVPKDGAHVRAAEVKLAQLRWSMERRDAAKFGNKSAITVKVPIQIITPLNLGKDANVEVQDIYTLEAVKVDETPPPEPLALPPPKPVIQPKRKRQLTPPGELKKQ